MFCPNNKIMGMMSPFSIGSFQGLHKFEQTNSRFGWSRWQSTSKIKNELQKETSLVLAALTVQSEGQGTPRALIGREMRMRRSETLIWREKPEIEEEPAHCVENPSSVWQQRTALLAVAAGS